MDIGVLWILALCPELVLQIFMQVLETLGTDLLQPCHHLDVLFQALTSLEWYGVILYKDFDSAAQILPSWRFFPSARGFWAVHRCVARLGQLSSELQIVGIADLVAPRAE